MKPFIYIVADDPTDPVVGAEPMARASMWAIGEVMHSALASAGISPWTFRPHSTSDKLFTHESATVSPSDATTTNLNPLFSILVRTLSEERGVAFGETVGVWFDDATGFDVPTFVEAWRRVYPFRELPPFFGMAHSSNRRGYATPSILNYQGYGLAALAAFKAVFAPSERLAETLKPHARARVVAPYFTSYSLPTIKPRPGDDGSMYVNWMYGFSQVDNYDRYVLLINQLNDILHDRALNATRDNTALPDDEPRVFSGRIFAESFPAAVKRPNGFDSGEIPCATHIPFGILQANLMTPDVNSITVSFDARGESDYRLLALADRGYMVFAPNVGVYRENINPLFLYDAAMLESFDPGRPHQATMHTAEQFFVEILKVRNAWRARGGNHNIRAVSRARALVGGTHLTDMVLSEMGVSYDKQS